MPSGSRAFPVQHTATLEVPISLQWKECNNELLNASLRRATDEEACATCAWQHLSPLALLCCSDRARRYAGCLPPAGGIESAYGSGVQSVLAIQASVSLPRDT